MTYSTRIALIVFTAAVVLFSPGCSRKVSTGGEAEKSLTKEQPGRVSETDEGKRKLVFGSLKKDGEPQKKTVSPVTDLLPGDYPVMLASIPSIGMFPSDMIIGELQDVNSLDTDIKDLYKTVNDFFLETFKGGVEEKFLKQSSREVIARIIDKSSFRGKGSVRLGKFILKEDYIEIPVRLLSENGRSEGSIVAEKENGVWLISGLSMDFNQLGKQYVPAEEPYEPDSYMNLRLEY